MIRRFIKSFAPLFICLFITHSALCFSVNFDAAVTIGGINQWISIKGMNNDDPVLLFLHGGPGNSAMGYAGKFTKELQKHFIVVQWDQRESGATAKLNSTDKPLTVALMESDAVEVIEYLKKKFSKTRIYLVGHSWGGFLGLKIAADHPDLLEACFAVSPMIYQDESEKLSLEWMKARAGKKGNKKESQELDLVHVPFRTADDLYYHRKWLAVEMGSAPKDKKIVDEWARKWLALFMEASAFNFPDAIPQISCPVYFMIGSKDRQTNFKLAEDYFKMMKAGKKDLFWFTDSAHSPNITEPEKFQAIIISHRNLKN